MALLVNSGQIEVSDKHQYNYQNPINKDIRNSDAISIKNHTGKAKTDTDGNLTFWDLLDIINPLQHIPGVSSLYRAITGDEIGSLAKIAGSTLYGGPLGMASSLIDVAVDVSTGKDIGEHALNTLNLSPDNIANQTEQKLPLTELTFNAVDSNPYLVKTAILAQELAGYSDAKNIR